MRVVVVAGSKRRHRRARPCPARSIFMRTPSINPRRARSHDRARVGRTIARAGERTSTRERMTTAATRAGETATSSSSSAAGGVHGVVVIDAVSKSRSGSFAPRGRRRRGRGRRFRESRSTREGGGERARGRGATIDR